jgi:phosphatidylserine/phosphatidylglycerophosphate/cardiolipin synthase-like enzyme
MANNRGVKGRIVFAEAGEPPIPNVAVVAFDIDPFNADDALGKEVLTTSNGEFTIDYSPDSYRAWIADRKPDIEVRVYGPGKRVLWQSEVHENVDVDVLPLDPIKIHRSNFPTSDPADPSWLVCHTSLDPANGTPVRLTTGNEIEWLIDGATMFPALTDAIEGAHSSVRFMNLNFYIKGLLSKFTFPPGVPPEQVQPTDVVTVSRLERILKRKAKAQPPVAVNVLVWELENITDLLVKLLDKADTADEIRAFFKDTGVIASSFESTQLLHIKLAVIDGTSAFVIGSTVNQTYFTDGRHLIRDPRHGRKESDPSKGRKELIHDMSLRVKGPAVRHVDETFTTIWNVGPIAPVISPSPMPGPVTSGGSVQMLRTMPGEVFAKDPPNPNDPADLPFGETGILEAYQRAIMKAEEYIYIEDQYLVSQDIADAIALRMKEKPDLEVILLLNVKPDIPGYHRKQAALLTQLRDALPASQRNRLGVFTIWSTDDSQPRFEIAHIYVHAKLAVIDDKWATVGTANLDGASLNRRQWGLILKAELGERLDSLIADFKSLGLAKELVIAILGPLYLALFLIVWGPLLLLAGAVGATFSLPTLVGFVFGALLKETARDSQHANPHRKRQPPRHPELNLVLYDGIAGQTATATTPGMAEQLRRALWEEHLGHPPAQTRPAAGWLSEWRAAADAHKTRLQEVARPLNPVRPGPQTAKVLEWVPDPKPADYLRTLAVEVDNITVRASGEPIPFVLHEVDTQ